MRQLWLALVAGLLLSACSSLPPPAARTPPPADLAAALERAREAADKGRWTAAWALLANRPEVSDEKSALQSTVLQGLNRLRDEATAAARSRQAEDLEASLALIGGRSWAPASPAPSEAPATSPAQWIKGAATVVVNKGLKVENGLAQPDIVIGSGFFLSADGLLLTNYHVIESEVEPGTSPSSKLSLRLPNSKGERLPARVVGWDRNSDLALLKAEYKPDFVFTLSTRDDPGPGSRLQAVGSPGGLESTLTEGIVSAVDRPLLAVGSVLQVDAAVNPGNSGGPLLNARGEVVGVVFAGIREFQGVNFAIPASLVSKILPRLKAGGRAVLPWIGLGLQEDARGLEVLYLAPGSPADAAGVQVGDRLTAVAGQAVHDLPGAQIRLLDFGSDAVLPLDLERQGRALRLWTTLEPRPDLPLKAAALNDRTSRVLPLAFGVAVEDLAAPEERRFRVTKVWPGTAADELSLAENDPLEVLDWVADTKEQVLGTRWKVKRRLGGYLESVIELGVPFSSRLFL